MPNGETKSTSYSPQKLEKATTGLKMLRSESHDFEDFNKLLDMLSAIMKSPSSLSSIRNYFQVSFETEEKKTDF